MGTPSPLTPPRADASPEAIGARVGALYAAHGRMVLGLCHVVLRDPDDAQDAAQQTFLSAHKSLLSGNEPRNSATWLAAIARNECRSRIRDRMTTPLPIDDDRPSDLRGPEEIAVARADLRETMEALSDLPERQRDALVMRSVMGLSYREVATALDTSIPVVESLLFRARRKLSGARLGQTVAAHGALLAPAATLQDDLARLIPGFESGVAAAAIGIGGVAAGLGIAGGAGAGITAAGIGSVAAPVSAKIIAAATAVTLGVAAAPAVLEEEPVKRGSIAVTTGGLPSSQPPAGVAVASSPGTTGVTSSASSAASASAKKKAAAAKKAAKDASSNRGPGSTSSGPGGPAAAVPAAGGIDDSDDDLSRNRGPSSADDSSSHRGRGGDSSRGSDDGSTSSGSDDSGSEKKAKKAEPKKSGKKKSGKKKNKAPSPLTPTVEDSSSSGSGSDDGPDDKSGSGKDPNRIDDSPDEPDHP